VILLSRLPDNLCLRRVELLTQVLDPLTRSESYQYDLASNMTQLMDRKSQ